MLAQDEEGTQRNDSFGGRANSCGVGSLVQVRSVHLAYQRRLSGGQSEMRGVKALRMGSSAQGPGLVMSFFMSGPRKTRLWSVELEAGVDGKIETASVLRINCV